MTDICKCSIYVLHLYNNIKLKLKINRHEYVKIRESY